MTMDYYSELRAMNNAQAAYDGQEASEYYEDGEDFDEVMLAKQREDSEDERHQARRDDDEYSAKEQG